MHLFLISSTVKIDNGGIFKTIQIHTRCESEDPITSCHNLKMTQIQPFTFKHNVKSVILKDLDMSKQASRT